MKTLLICMLVLLSSFCYSQSPKQKLSRDSARYYQQQLRELTKSTYDSLANTEKYKMLSEKLNLNRTEDNFGVELSFIVGYQKYNYEHLDSRFDSLKIKKAITGVAPIGFALAFRFNKFIIGYDMCSLVGNKTSGGYFHGFISTNMLKLKSWIISPQIGYGTQTEKVKVSIPSSSSNFNDYFTTSANNVELTHSNAVLDFALAFKVYPVRKNEYYLPLVRIGYHYGLSERRWKVTDGNSTNAPLDRNNSFYIQTILGFGN